MNFFKITLFGIATFLLCFFINYNGHAQDFEGIIHYETPTQSQAQMGGMKYMMKGKQVRMEMGQNKDHGTVAIIYQPEKAETVVVIERMQAYMKMESRAAAGSQTGSAVEAPNVEKTGKTKTIAGRSCEIWHIEHEGGEHYSMCMNKELGPFITPQNPISNQQAPAWAQSMDPGPAFPLEIKKTSGDEQVILRVTQIEEKSLDASLFEIPEGYRDMSGMMKNMKQ